MGRVTTGPRPPEPPSPSQRGRGRPSTLDRLATLEATWRVIAARGLDRARYTDIARESGTPVSTLQNAFGTLDALLGQAVDHAIERDAMFLASIPTAADAGPLARLDALAGGSVGDAYGLNSWLVWLELWRAAARDDARAEQTAQGYARWWAAAESIIRHGQETGDFTAEEHPRDLAIAMISLLDGCAVAMLMPARNPDPETARRVALLGIRRLLRT